MAVRKLFAVLAICSLFLSSFAKIHIPMHITKVKPSSSIAPHEQMTQHPMPSMYEISTRPWLFSLSQKYSRSITRLADIPVQEFQALKDAGITMVWMMGLWEIGQYGLNFDRTNSDLLSFYSQILPGYTQADIIGSPYAVYNFTCNPELGSDADILALKHQLNSMGLELMTDFVPNHSSVDNVWASEHPEYYIRSPKGSPIDSSRYDSNGLAYGWSGYGDAWFDTLQFNYWNLETRKAMTAKLMHVASLSDAIRCDMAYLLINSLFGANWGSQASSWGYSQPSSEFWHDAIAEVKAAYPNVRFLAEVYSGYESNLQAQGFDFTYDKTIYDLLTAGNLDNIRGYISSTSIAYFQHSAHFVENHDEQRAVANFGSWQRADAAAAVTMTIPGMKFYNDGQWQGLRNRLAVQLRRSASEPAVPDVEAFYAKLVSITSDPVFHVGNFVYLTVSNADTAWRLMAWRYSYNNGTSIEKRLVVVNYSDTQGQGAVVCSDASGSSDTINVTELFSNTVYQRSANQMRSTGLYVIIAPWSAQIFAY